MNEKIKLFLQKVEKDEALAALAAADSCSSFTVGRAFGSFFSLFCLPFMIWVMKNWLKPA